MGGTVWIEENDPCSDDSCPPTAQQHLYISATVKQLFSSSAPTVVEIAHTAQNADSRNNDRGYEVPLEENPMNLAGSGKR